MNSRLELIKFFGLIVVGNVYLFFMVDEFLCRLFGYDGKQLVGVTGMHQFYYLLILWNKNKMRTLYKYNKYAILSNNLIYQLEVYQWSIYQFIVIYS